MKRENKKIRNATVCKTEKITFKSQLEKNTYNILKELGLNPQYEPKTYTLWEGFTPITPFYDKETSRQQEKRLEEGGKEKSKILVLKKDKIVGIRYTPDFYIKYNNIDVYIETKGKENDVYYIKKKLFRYYLDKKFQETGQHSLFFEVYTKKQVLQAVEIMKNYEQSISNLKEGSTMPTP